MTYEDLSGEELAEFLEWCDARAREDLAHAMENQEEE